MNNSNDLRDILRDTVDRLFGDRIDRKLMESAEGGTWPEGLWNALAENGLTQPLIPEEAGGVGAGWADSFVILRASGYYTAPVPLAETILAGWLLDRVGLAVPEGPITLAPVRAGETLAFDGKTVSGEAGGVPWGRHAGHVVVLTDASGGPWVALIDSGSCAIRHDRNIGRDPRDTLVFDRAPAVASAAAGGRLSAETVQTYGAMARCAQTAGALARVLEESTRYATEREQFGRPIAKFQAIQHQLATLAASVAQAKIAAETAFTAADSGDPGFETACAKVISGEAATLAAATGHQVLGAIGFTQEHALHFATRRLWSWRAEFGAESHWAEQLGRRAAGRGADALWPDLTARQAREDA